MQGDEAVSGAAGAGAGPGGGEVRIVAPLGAPRSPASSPTMTASLVPLTSTSPDTGTGGGLDNLTSFETTTQFEERTTRYNTIQY